MTGQRLVAALLTLLFLALVLVVFVALFRVFGHPGWGWVAGLVFIALMVLGFVRQGRRPD